MALIGLAQPAAGGIDLAHSSVAVYDYDDHHDVATLPTVMNERGQPNIVGRETTYVVAGRGSHCSSACSRTVPTYAYNSGDKVGQAARLASGGMATMQEQARRSSRELQAIPSASVAAKAEGVAAQATRELSVDEKITYVPSSEGVQGCFLV